MSQTRATPLERALRGLRGARSGAPAATARTLGQSLAEFALTLPMTLFMILFGLDFGRVFMGWIELNSATREAASFAAVNPNAWSDGDLAVQAEYTSLLTQELSGINCIPDALSAPTFPNGTTIGSPAVVQLTCRFSLITPIMGNLFGAPVPVSASSAFPIRAGTIMDVPVASALPSPSAAPSDTPAPSAAPTDTPAPTAGPTDTPAPTGTPAPTVTPVPGTCNVPNFRNKSTSIAVSMWTSAGFQANNILFSPLVPPHYSIRSQSIPQNQWAPCSATITVTGRE